MVGIPGKSKGCNTCRRRKKGCDLQRPTCGQCRRLNIVCGGYARDTVWVNMTPGAVPVRCRSPHLATAAAQSEITLADTLVRTAYHEKYLGMFWSSYLPNGRNFPPESVEYTSGVWMNDLYRLFRTGNQLALKKIMLAIAVTGVGEHDDNSWMVEKGIALYGDALATLAALLETRDSTVRESNFVTTKLLSLYEILYGHNQQDRLHQIKSWYLHLQGELGLIAACGPEAYATGFAHQLFIDGRGTQISYSLESRTSTFLNEPAWKTMPWKYHPKMAKDLLGDIFAEIPGMLGELDAVRALPDSGLREIERQSLVSKCRRVEADWLRWGCESAPPKSPAGTLDTMQASQIFDHLIAAHIMSAYYATGVFLYSVLGHATGSGTSEGSEGLSMPRMLCRKMLEIIPAFLNPYAGKWGVHGAIFPSIVIITYVDEVDEGIPPTEKDALYKLFSQGKNGRTIQRFVDNMLDRFRSRGSQMFS